MFDDPKATRREAAKRALAGLRRKPVRSGEDRRDMRQATAYLAGREPRRMEREAR